MQRRKFITRNAVLGLGLALSPQLLMAGSRNKVSLEERELLEAFRHTVSEYPTAQQQGGHFVSQLVEPVTFLERGKERLRYLNGHGQEILLVKRKGQLIFSCH